MLLRIRADDRESGSAVPDALRALPGVELTIGHLATGDYLVENVALFERKTLADFAASILDTRLFRQAYRLMRSELPGTIILEGKASDLASVGVSREALQGGMVSLATTFRLPVLRSRDAAETAALLVYAAQQIRRRANRPGPRSLRRPKTRRLRQLQLLRMLPGVGRERAQLLLEAFGSVGAVMKADCGDLQTIPGIGPRTAESIVDILRDGPPPPYAAEQDVDW